MVRGLNFSYEEEGGTPALCGVDLTILSGTVTVLIGPSGCGKTTLCKCLCGIIPKLIHGVTNGEVFVFGREIANDESIAISSLSEQIGLVMQVPDHQIVMTAVEDDVAFGPENRMMPPPEVRDLVDHTLSEMDLTQKAEADPSALSGGEKQRLAIAGVLAMGPEIMVFDEPVSSLDSAGRDHFVQIVKALKEAGKTIIIVEHDFEVFDFADQWVLMKEGRIVCASAPREIPRELVESELWH
jgi:energy-coupling factor transporter ATP-binding protein EcfA2